MKNSCDMAATKNVCWFWSVGRSMVKKILSIRDKNFDIQKDALQVIITSQADLEFEWMEEAPSQRKSIIFTMIHFRASKWIWISNFILIFWFGILFVKTEALLLVSRNILTLSSLLVSPFQEHVTAKCEHVDLGHTQLYRCHKLHEIAQFCKSELLCRFRFHMARWKGDISKYHYFFVSLSILVSFSRPYVIADFITPDYRSVCLSKYLERCRIDWSCQ